MQGSHDWQATLAAGYQQDQYLTLRADPCIHYRREGDEYTITSMCGNNVCRGSTTKAVCDLEKQWEANKVTSEVLLGMTIHQDPISKAISISQRAYFQRMLTHFGLENVCQRNTPLPPNIKLCGAPNPLLEDELKFMHNQPYRVVVGSILWGHAQILHLQGAYSHGTNSTLAVLTWSV